MEDDCYLDIVRYWNFDWKSVVAKFPYDWDVVQLVLLSALATFILIFIVGFVNDFSTACYVISRHHAEKILKHHVKGKDKYRLDNGVKPRPVADDLIYNSGVTYAIPLLLYKTELGSSIHPEHVDIFHKGSYTAINNYWDQNGANLDINVMMDYNPYLGRVVGQNSQGSENPQT